MLGCNIELTLDYQFTATYGGVTLSKLGTDIPLYKDVSAGR
jgi:hypothetical protein